MPQHYEQERTKIQKKLKVILMIHLKSENCVNVIGLQSLQGHILQQLYLLLTKTIRKDWTESLCW